MRHNRGEEGRERRVSACVCLGGRGRFPRHGTSRMNIKQKKQQEQRHGDKETPRG